MELGSEFVKVKSSGLQLPGMGSHSVWILGLLPLLVRKGNFTSVKAGTSALGMLNSL